MTALTTSTAALFAAFPAMADEEPHADVFVEVVDGRLATGSVDVDDLIIEHDVRVFESEFGEVSPNVADEPGYFTNVLSPGTSIGFNIVAPLRKWNGTDFSTIPAETLTLSQALGIPGAPEVTTPTTPGSRVFGFNFATADSNGVFDDHPDMRLDSPASDGVYLLSLVLKTDAPGIGNSLPFHIVLGQNALETDIEAAEEFAELNARTLPAPGATGLAMLAGAALLRRRR